MSIRQAFTMERWEEKLPTCHLAGFLEAKPPHLWVILTDIEVKGRNASNEFKWIEGMNWASSFFLRFSDLVIFQVCGVDSLTEIWQDFQDHPSVSGNKSRQLAGSFDKSIYI